MLSVLLFQEIELWVAQCLEHDIAAQGNQISETVSEWGRMYQAYKALEAIPETAPAIYWSRYDEAERIIPINADETPGVNYRVFVRKGH